MGSAAAVAERGREGRRKTTSSFPRFQAAQREAELGEVEEVELAELGRRVGGGQRRERKEALICVCVVGCVCITFRLPSYLLAAQRLPHSATIIGHLRDGGGGRLARAG